MKITTFKQLFGMTLTGVLTLAGAGVLAFEPAARADGRGIEGTWIARIRIVTCPPAPRVVLASFQSMVTYLEGGTQVEGGAPPGPPPAVSRSSGHGIWERTGHNSFRTLNRFSSFDALGRLVSITTISNHTKRIHGDNPETPDVVEPYYLSGTATNEFTFFDPVDGSVTRVVEGCSESTNEPVLFDD